MCLLNKQRHGVSYKTTIKIYIKFSKDKFAFEKHLIISKLSGHTQKLSLILYITFNKAPWLFAKSQLQIQENINTCETGKNFIETYT